MLWFKAFHVISIVCWFAGLFYLPRLYVYHAMTDDANVARQLGIMEHKLYYYIMTPAAIATVIFGLCLWLPHYQQYAHALWLHVKLILVLLLVVYHLICGYFLHLFKYGRNHKTHKFFRFFNEVPTVILVVVVLLTYLKP
ncbi:MAG: protoporphyrinogen oxidase HemJ [Pseudomonadota bacterium]